MKEIISLKVLMSPIFLNYSSNQSLISMFYGWYPTKYHTYAIKSAGGAVFLIRIHNMFFWFKLATQEDPKPTCSHRHTESTATYGIIPSERNPETSSYMSGK